MELLQTIGICIGSIALVAIAVMMFLIMTIIAEPREEVFYGSVSDIMDHLVDEKPQRRQSRKRSRDY